MAAIEGTMADDSDGVASAQGSPGGARAPRLGGYVPLVACLTLLAIVLSAFQLTAAAGRSYAEGHTHYAIGGPSEGMEILRSSGVRGRTLVLFDRTSHIEQRFAAEFVPGLGGEASPTLNSDNFVEAFLLSGAVRRVFVVVPDPEWRSIERSASGRGDMTTSPGRVTGWLYGSPVTYVTGETLPRLREKVVVYVEGSRAAQYDQEVLSAFDSGEASDLYIVRNAP